MGRGRRWPEMGFVREKREHKGREKGVHVKGKGGQRSCEEGRKCDRK